MKNQYRSIFISDVHLGTRDCKAVELHNFLKHNKCETLYLVGDIIDVIEQGVTGFMDKNLELAILDCMLLHRDGVEEHSKKWT